MLLTVSLAVQYRRTCSRWQPRHTPLRRCSRPVPSSIIPWMLLHLLAQLPSAWLHAANAVARQAVQHSVPKAGKFFTHHRKLLCRCGVRMQRSAPQTPQSRADAMTAHAAQHASASMEAVSQMGEGTGRTAAECPCSALAGCAGCAMYGCARSGLCMGAAARHRMSGSQQIGSCCNHYA